MSVDRSKSLGVIDVRGVLWLLQAVFIVLVVGGCSSGRCWALPPEQVNAISPLQVVSHAKNKVPTLYLDGSEGIPHELWMPYFASVVETNVNAFKDNPSLQAIDRVAGATDFRQLCYVSLDSITKAAAWPESRSCILAESVKAYFLSRSEAAAAEAAKPDHELQVKWSHFFPPGGVFSLSSPS